ncbi:hypothetical protein CERZMDRAFT_94204 [Cercospora zeae-maydis SCOH1-5]|uniref:Uncharacterized protein n=1 Tax=Cercospora zeae-maydis SCOH1-5 TaxID=717836 RepID=A0A6A6FQU6_9PEZI|nr:hypothetical protein CERZMDRAFT_94204 [Cercospora zeae-maydis SCOH1-5]
MALHPDFQSKAESNGNIIQSTREEEYVKFKAPGMKALKNGDTAMDRLLQKQSRFDGGSWRAAKTRWTKHFRPKLPIE